jgi:hypothetical protein
MAYISWVICNPAKRAVGNNFEIALGGAQLWQQQLVLA